MDLIEHDSCEHDHDSHENSGVDGGNVRKGLCCHFMREHYFIVTSKFRSLIPNSGSLLECHLLHTIMHTLTQKLSSGHKIKNMIEQIMFDPSNCSSHLIPCQNAMFDPSSHNALKRKMFAPSNDNGNGNGKKMKCEITECKKKKTVRFAEFSHLVLIEPKSSTDIQNTWFSQKETAKFKRDVHLAAKAMRETRTAKVIKYIAHSAATRTPHVNVHIRGNEIIRGVEHLLSPEVCVFLGLWACVQLVIWAVLLKRW